MHFKNVETKYDDFEVIRGNEMNANEILTKKRKVATVAYKDIAIDIAIISD